MAGRDTLDRFGRYCELLDSLTGVKPVISDVEPRVVEDGPVRAISYIGTPEPGYVTGFTYGLSLYGHPDWGPTGRELCITVRSGDVEWSQVPARVVAALRGICPFTPGQVLGYKEPYVGGSSMNSIVLAKPALELGSGPLDLGSVEGGAKVLDLVEIVGAYPIHSSEREFAYSHGFDALWSLKWDRFDPARGPVA
ncbi:suppressor of fused domain protein [Streptomyces griseoincarnatus]|uniref:suppressor of fused domain protein n=1 Tax=Streptomyces sp. SMS_SU21 TaxID=2069440 RepID=UPI000C88B0FB|nr:suppressor of fused domain protein [Streptomyces sp. SMS_SU21]MCA2203345.1 suppressor of fused domain protein [Streptomyces sp. SMS_SU21]